MLFFKQNYTYDSISTEEWRGFFKFPAIQGNVLPFNLPDNIGFVLSDYNSTALR